MAQLSFISVIILSVIVESFLYGIFVVSFFGALYLRLSNHRDHSGRGSRTKGFWGPIAVPTIATFATCTAAFGSSGDSSAALEFYLQPSQPLVVIQSVLVILTDLIGDAIIIQRLWFIWNRGLPVIVVPILSWLGVIMSYLLTQFRPGTNISYKVYTAWITAGWALTAINLRVTDCFMGSQDDHTVFIAWKIWRTNCVTGAIGGGLLMYVLAILIESAAIWAYGSLGLLVWAVFFAVTTQTGSSLQILAIGIAPPIIGLVDTLIYLRVGLGWSFTPSTENSGGIMTTTMLMVPTMSESDDLDSVSVIPGAADKA
ncbi:hypothetical protein DFH08DRAFT_814564 [Mycena albidolilacea]|uniref:Uncharacterized protein n=1 Tax=Mycena albidolilacea TaxID=1033008 RepID=A0AAD6ZQX4_9AGAR|nr:hypothetical protein DFH08DRAFT_814564 [Mycena albidolilacea]